MSSFPSGTALAILAMRDAIMRSTESWQNIPSFSVGRTFGNGGSSISMLVLLELYKKSLVCCVVLPLALRAHEPNWNKVPSGMSYNK